MTNGSTDDEKLARLLEHFAERLNLVFAYFFCTLEFEGDEDFVLDAGKSDRAWALQTMQNACLHTTLIALRDVDSFLRSEKSRRDDLSASDFGYSAHLGFLAKSERDNISKLIAHSTLPGATAVGFRWDIFELVTKCVKQSDQFLEWTEQHLASDAFLTWTAATVCRRKTQAIYGYVARAVDASKPKGEPRP